MAAPPAPAPKREARTRLRAQRRELAAGRDRAADDANLARHGLALVLEAAARHTDSGSRPTVTLYEALEVEPPTAGLIAALREAGVRVIVPITTPDLDLDWSDVADSDRTPLGLDAIALADVVLTPGLAVNRDRVRLGQGGACYDKALPRRRGGVPVITMVHPEELTDEDLPHEDHDHLVDATLTADGVTWL